MSFSEDPLIGKVVWSDLMTEDLEKAKRFYGGLFGWTFERSSVRDGHDYLIAKSGPVYVAGLMSVARRDDGEPVSRWLPFISVADVDRSTARATALGAQVVVAPRDVSLGRVAALIDPEGAVIGLARSEIGDPDDNTTAPAIGRIVWTELLANDSAAAAKFYAEIAGYDPRAIERRGGVYTMLTHAGSNRAGILQNPVREIAPVWLTYFAVADPVAAAARVPALGGVVLLPPSPGLREGSMAVVTDPSGAVLVLQRLPT
jgi:predicted enzyme related to lactoylglutathione lyase